jgi:hypothetical protein
VDAAPTAYTSWQRVLRYDPADPGWINHDRFVLSSGHASMLLYSLIHLSAIKLSNPSYEELGRDAVTLDHIRTLRQAGSRCPGHPEYSCTSGVETTTGPLGQGASTSAGMAVASRWLAATPGRCARTPGWQISRVASRIRVKGAGPCVRRSMKACWRVSPVQRPIPASSHVVMSTTLTASCRQCASRSVVTSSSRLRRAQ